MTYEDTARSLLRIGALEEVHNIRQTMRCGCTVDNEHPGRQGHEQGCGAIWNLEVFW
jgi:hypothetical protein